MQLSKTLLLFSFFCIHAEVLEVSLGLGPGFDYGAQHLLPTVTGSGRIGSKLLTTFNFQSAWNLCAVLKGLVKVPFAHYFDITTEVGGGWVRNGTGIITNSEIGLLAGESAPLNVLVREDILDVIGCGGVTFFKERPVTCRVSAGYALSKVITRLPFLQSTVVFFEKNSYKGPFIGFDCSIKIHDNSILKIIYKEVFGNMRIRATENDSDQVVLRCIPRMCSTVIGCKLRWYINDHFLVAPQLFYINNQNHARGFSLSNTNGVWSNPVQNVDSLLLRQLIFILELAYSF